jgi:hypothetical protein
MFLEYVISCLHNLLTFMFIYCIGYRLLHNHKTFLLYFVKYAPIRKIFIFTQICTTHKHILNESCRSYVRVMYQYLIR